MALGLGSIAFTGFNADGGDNLAFVALEAIAAGTVIYFQDNEWQGAGFNTGESGFSWTANAEIAAGTVVTIDNISAATPTSNLGTVLYLDNSNRGYSNDGEIVYAFVGTSVTAPTAFLAAVANNGLTNGATLDGTGLVEGVNALSFSGGIDIAGYNGARNNQTSFAAYAAQLNNAANFLTQNGSGDQSIDGTAPDAPFPTTAFTLGLPAQTLGFTASSLTVARPEGDSGTVNFTFTVERLGGTGGAVTFSGTIAAGTTDAADFGGTQPLAFSGTIAAGAASTIVTIAASGDLDIEATENFVLALTTASNDLGVTVTIDAAKDEATGRILNDDAGPVVGGITVYDAAESLAGAVDTPVATNDVQLIRLGAFTGTGGTAAGRAESLSYDTATGKLYITNLAAGVIDIAQINADGSTTAAGSIALGGLENYGGVNSVAVKNGMIAVAYPNATPGGPGYVALYDTATNTLQKLLQVGVGPDQIVFSPDGTKILTADEAETISAGNNPAGTVTIIDVSGGAANATISNTISFASLNGEELVLRDRGLATFAGQQAGNDIEPEYITVSADGTRAYVTLQEVNAVAVIDLTDPAADRPIAIKPLGSIDRSLAGNQFDPNDQNGISIANFPVSSLPQPDAIASFTIAGVTYFVTANEGDARVGGLVDEVRLSSAGYVLDPTAFPNAAALKANAQLGRLNVLTNVGDTDGDGDFDQIFTFGGRGISIFRQNADGSIDKVRETGGEFERIIAALDPALHNTENLANPDNRSDNKGPEPESVTIGEVAGRTYAFVTLERVGGVMIYDVTDPANAFYVGYRPPTAQDFAPEVVIFIKAEDSPTGAALVVSANEVSGTTTVYSVAPQSPGDDLILGGPDADRLEGRGGNDTIKGAGGTDTAVYSGTRDDYLITALDGGGFRIADQRAGPNDGTDTVTFVETFVFADRTLGADALIFATATLSGTNRADDFVDIADRDLTYFAGNGADLVDGGNGSDTIDGGNGNDTIRGGSGRDVLIGGNGADQLFGDAGNDTIDGGNGDDIVDGGDGEDVIDGGNGEDVLNGGAGNDILRSGRGDGTLNGGDGDDVLIGGIGDAFMTGGSGTDQFVIGRAGKQVIFDFEQGSETIDLSAFGIANFQSLDTNRDGIIDTDDRRVHLTKDGLMLTLNGNTTLLLTGIEALNPADLIFGT